ncbi:MAG: hypothetical protein NTW71_11115 [Deltaproteobacteria bacterium]|nr:hypothetical protein [Deltaproteobacteria bacterium]
MNSRIKRMNLFRFVVFAAAGVLMISCVPKAQRPLYRLDTPEHHTFTGIRLLDQEKFAEAGREFELALRLDPRYAKAHAGTGLVKAYQGDFTGGLEFLKQAEKHAQSDEEKIFVRVGYIRVNTLSHAACLRIGSECKSDDAWLQHSKEAFDQAVLIDPKADAAYYFMGECYLTALDLDQSGRMFDRALNLNGEYAKEAESRLNLVQKIRRAIPGRGP